MYNKYLYGIRKIHLRHLSAWQIGCEKFMKKVVATEVLWYISLLYIYLSSITYIFHFYLFYICHPFFSIFSSNSDAKIDSVKKNSRILILNQERIKNLFICHSLLIHPMNYKLLNLAISNCVSMTDYVQRKHFSKLG